ncbi:MAG TPA: sensor histidine kinase [Gemmatimonadaceae bacterium]
MDAYDNCPLARTLAVHLRAAREELTARWLERIAVRVSLDRNQLFPTEELLDHVPLLIDGIAAYLENPADEIAADVPVVAKAMELGEMRYRQGFDAYQISKEYELLGGVLFTFLARIVDQIDQPCSREELLQCAHRVFRAVTLIQQFTLMHFLRKSGERVREREERLRAFNRTVSHELKSRVGAIKGAHALLGESWLEPAERQTFHDMIGENVAAIEAVLANLLALSGLDGEARQQRNVRLPAAVAEVVRQLRGSARARKVAVRVAADLPEVEVNAAAVELCLTNYLSNAIKYADSAKEDRWVEIRGRLVPRPAGDGALELVVEVRDNGLGVPIEERYHLFERFYRTREAVVTGVEGTGLGLSIVRETVETLGGRAWIEPSEELGTTFAFALPFRRANDLRETDGADLSTSRPADPSSR